MAKQLSKSGITTGDAIEPWHVSQSIDALSGEEAYNLKISGSLQLTGSINMPAGSVVEGTASYSSYALTASYALNGGGGGGNPGGDNNSIQYKNGTNFNGQSDFLYIPSSKTLEVTTGSINHVSSSFIGASIISASTIQAGTFVGNISADEIRTPALIGGVASTLENASSSITPEGYARFVSASIGGWDITPDSIESNSMIMRPEGLLQTKNFASSQTGWRISAEGNGTAEFENARIRGTLSTTTFEKETVNAVGGQLWVVNSTTITGSSVTSLATTMSVANASGFSQGEILLAKKVDNTGFSTEYILVNSSSIDGDSSGASETYGRIMVTRGYGQGQSGNFVGDLASSPQAYTEGQVLVSTGKVGTGFIKLNANPNDLETPYIDITERTGSGIFDVELKARLGDLSGLANSDYVFNRPNPGFGLATDNVFLQGGIKATFGEIGGFGITSNSISSSNNDLILRSSGKITASGGFLFGNKSTAQYVQYDGSSLVVRGNLSVDNIQTPALINGSPSTITNASASITSDGFAKFVSASIAGFTVNETEIKSTGDLLRLKASGDISASRGVLLGSKSTNQYLSYHPAFGLEVKGNLNVDQISTPAGLPEAQASSSIKADGFARFVSASIAGFDISDSTIRQFTPSSSSISNTNVSLTGFSLTGNPSVSSLTISNNTTGATNGYVFTGYIRRASGASSDDFTRAGIGQDNATATFTVGTSTVTLTNSITTGGNFETSPQNGFNFYTTDVFSTTTFVSSSNVSHPAAESILIDAGNQKIVVGGTSGNNLILNGANGTITASAANISGKITADEGAIGGTVIESTKLKSSTNLPSPDGNPAFQLNSNGVISGSDMILRNVYNVGGTSTAFTLVDTVQGYFIGRNIGRQVVSNNTEFTAPYAANNYALIYSEVFNLLPFEDKFLLAFTSLHENTSTSTGQTADLSFRLATMNSGSANGANTYYNSWNNEVVLQDFNVTVRNNGTLSPRSYGRNSQNTPANNIAIPSTHQAQTVRFSVYARLSNTTCSAKIRGISLIATNTFASDFQTTTEVAPEKG